MGVFIIYFSFFVMPLDGATWEPTNVWVSAAAIAYVVIYVCVSECVCG